MLIVLVSVALFAFIALLLWAASGPLPGENLFAPVFLFSVIVASVVLAFAGTRLGWF